VRWVRRVRVRQVRWVRQVQVRRVLVHSHPRSNRDCKP
jgi:hypothetical protein